MFLVLGFMGSDSGLYTRLLVTSRLHCQGASFLFEQSPALHIMDSKSGGVCWVRDYALRVCGSEIWAEGPGGAAAAVVGRWSLKKAINAGVVVAAGIK